MTESEKQIRKALADIDIQNTHLGVEMATSNLKLVCTKASITELLARLDASEAVVDAARVYYEKYAKDEARDGDTLENWTGCSEAQSRHAINLRDSLAAMSEQKGQL